MSCYSPLSAIDFGLGPNGKHILKIIPKSFDLQKSVYSGAKIIPIPCGQCIGCRLDYSREWAERCMMEACLYDSNYFVTLTYDDKHLPPELVDPSTGELSKFHSVSRRDIQLFMKRLRKNTGQKIRYFGCAEYGPKNMRPHYHLILFNLVLNDLEVSFKKPQRDFVYYNSKTISDNWEKGEYRYQIVTKVSYDTCAYTARYILKKQKGINAAVYDTNLLTPEFSMMSRRPGIGAGYYDKYKDKIFMYDKFCLNTEDGTLKLKPPRYFEKLFDIDDHESYLQIKNYRSEKLENSMLLHKLGSSQSYKDILKSEEESKLAQIRTLSRKEFEHERTSR